MRLVILYSLFGAISTLVNLISQAFMHRLIPPSPGSLGIGYWAALVVGTLTGLVVKYVLDKRWIFFDQSAGIGENGKKFVLYSLMGVITTGIFWGVQTGFFLLWKSREMLYLGAAIGLAIGYFVKYRLDKHFVFASAGRNHVE